jgi:predicted RNase H-like nuclease (RuvC/YqgF family)
MMDWPTILALGQLVIGGGLGAAVLMHLREAPKSRADARKVTIAADAELWANLNQEIGRLSMRLEKVEKENEALRDRVERQRGRERTLEQENDTLRQHVDRLETRLAALEGLFKSLPLTPEMEAALSKLDEAGPRKRRVAR